MAGDPYKYFRIEAREIAGELSAGCVALEKTEGDREIVARLLRLAHTLKGAARIVKQVPIAELAHEIESLLEPARGGAAPTAIPEVLARVDAIARKIDELPGAAPAPAPTPAPREAAPAPMLVARPDTGAIEGVLASLSQVLAELARLKTDRDPRAAAARIEHLDRELREIRQDVEHLRLQPAGSLFATLERAARDAAGDHKRVELVGSGGEIRIDPVVLAQVHRALVQLVRNAVAHGIEPVADRRAAGKPETGRIHIAVASAGARVSFTCEDDGRGIDLEAVRRAAERTAAPAGGDVLARLLQGGLTTATSVTEHAGRGIGIDVVRDVAHEIGGELAARTDAGRGTAITISAPVSMASIRALMVRVGARSAAIPLAAVSRAITVRPEDLARQGDRTALALDDVLVPYRALGPLLRADAPVHARHPAIVLHDRGALAAVAVDRLLGVEEIVLRVVPAGVPIDPVIWGMALDDEGTPCPVIDPAAAIAAATRDAVAAPVAPASRGQTTVLVVDDSVTTRMLEQSILESAGYRVETAASAEEGLEKAAERPYALFMVDVEMPGMDGFGFVSTIRSRPATAQTPAILVTSRNAPADLRRGEEVGAQAYIVKSEFDQVALLATIRKLVGA